MGDYYPEIEPYDCGMPVEHFKVLYRGARLKPELQSRRDGARLNVLLAERVDQCPQVRVAERRWTARPPWG